MFVSFLSTILDASINTLLENEQLKKKDDYFPNSMFSQSTFPTLDHRKTTTSKTKQNKKTQHNQKPLHFSQLTSTTPTCITI